MGSLAPIHWLLLLVFCGGPLGLIALVVFLVRRKPTVVNVIVQAPGPVAQRERDRAGPSQQ